MAVGALVQSFRFGGVGLGLADPRTELDRTLDQLVDCGGVEPTELVQQAVGADQVPEDLVLLFVGCSTSHHRECGFVQPCQCGFEQRPLGSCASAPVALKRARKVVSPGTTVVVIASSSFSMSVAVGAAAQGVCAWARRPTW